MHARIDEIADAIYRLSVHVPDLGPGGFTFNHFLLKADEPLLFHCGSKAMFPLLRDAVSRVMAPDALRWISFGHMEGDECGSLNQWLSAAPGATVAQGSLACELGLDEFSVRAPRPLAEGEVLDLGGKRVRYLATPHVPHSWDAGVMYEECTGTLLCGDLFAQFGAQARRHDDIVPAAIEAQNEFGGTAVTTLTAPTLRRLAALQPRVLALMHGPSFSGDAGAQLMGLADYYESQLRAVE
jgi:flavorubredoxin